MKLHALKIVEGRVKAHVPVDVVVVVIIVVLNVTIVVTLVVLVDVTRLVLENVKIFAQEIA